MSAIQQRIRDWVNGVPNGESDIGLIVDCAIELARLEEWKRDALTVLTVLTSPVNSTYDEETNTFRVTISAELRDALRAQKEALR